MTSSRTARGRGQDGLTVVELMVVLVFVAVGILALSTVQKASLRDVYATGRHTRALDLAQMQMETARAAGFEFARSDSGVVDGMNWVSVVDSVEVGLRRVTTTGTWTEAGQPRSMQLVNLLSAR